MGNRLCIPCSSRKSERAQQVQIRFIRAIGQMEVLERYSGELQWRLEHAERNQLRPVVYQLRMKLAVVHSVSDMFLEYACRQLDTFFRLMSMRGRCDRRVIRSMFLSGHAGQASLEDLR